jgi:hypothetical protein
VRSEVSHGDNIYTVVFWVMTPFSLIYGYQLFGEICCLSLHSGTLKTNIPDSPESMVTIYQITGCHKPEDTKVSISRISRLNHIQYYMKLVYREYNIGPMSKSKELFPASLKQLLLFLFPLKG